MVRVCVSMLLTEDLRGKVMATAFMRNYLQDFCYVRTLETMQAEACGSVRAQAMRVREATHDLLNEMRGRLLGLSKQHLCSQHAHMCLQTPPSDVALLRWEAQMIQRHMCKPFVYAMANALISTTQPPFSLGANVLSRVLWREMATPSRGMPASSMYVAYLVVCQHARQTHDPPAGAGDGVVVVPEACGGARSGGNAVRSGAAKHAADVFAARRRQRHGAERHAVAPAGDAHLTRS